MTHMQYIKYLNAYIMGTAISLYVLGSDHHPLYCYDRFHLFGHRTHHFRSANGIFLCPHLYSCRTHILHPFCLLQKVFPGIGKKIMPISSQIILLLLLTKNYRFHNKVHTKMFYGWSNCKRIRD